MERFFRFLSFIPMPLWLAMIFAPHHRLTQRATRSHVVIFITAVNYLIAQLIGLSQGNRLDNPADFLTLDGIQQLIGSRSGALGAWSHMLALDLFTGVWIYKQCVRLNAPDWVRIPALLFTLMTGPFGLLLFLIWQLVTGRQTKIEVRLM